MATNPGVRVLFVDGFFQAAEDDNELASRMLVVARASYAADAGWRTSDNGQALYNPTQYKTESEVVEDWGAGSDAHVAFVQAVKAGAVNVYLSCTDPDPVEPGQNDAGAGYTAEEYEVLKALEFAEVANPDVIALFGYHANEYVAADAYYAAVPAARCAKYAAILATRCRELAEDVNPAIGFISPVDSITHLTALGRTVTPGVLSAADVGAYVDALKAAKHATFDYTAGNPLPFAEVQEVINAADAEDDLGKYLVIPVNELSVVGQPRDEEKKAPAVAVASATWLAEVLTVNTSAAHGLVAGNTVDIAGATTTAINGRHTVVAATDADTFTVALVADPGAITVGTATAAKVISLSGLNLKTCAVPVAAQVMRIGTSGAITLQPIQNIQNAQFNLTKSQRISLMDLQLVPVALNNRRIVSTIDGTTLAKEDTNGDQSVYARLFNMVVAGEVARITRRVIEPYIGKAAGVALLNSLETQLRARFLELKQFEVVREVRFTFRFSPITNKLTVSESVVPVGELRDVEVNVSVEI